MKSVELLAPAGDFNTLKAAVYAGADAVYFGGKGFNARTKANNFNEDLEEAVAFCHMYNVKSYFTLNTLIDNEQIPELIDCINYAISVGVDAFIVQDYGVFYILKNYYKNIEIHTSTQMAINNYQGALIAEQMGAKRVVVSREISLEDIKLIKQTTNLQIEAFIQGALCVCFSGNCFLSSYMFGKSGNKGECLQPCRLPVKAILKGKEVKRGYLLSAKDICLASRLKELVNAGVDSFKIEGRLRRLGYVGQVVKTYRSIIDNNFGATNEHITNLKKAFNRGDYTEGYLNGNDNIIYEHIQGHTGVCIGEVVAFKKGNRFNTVKINSKKHIISKGDGIKIINNCKEIATITAMDIKKDGSIYTITTTANLILGAKVHLIVDAIEENVIDDYIKRLPLSFKLVAKKDSKLCLEYYFNNISGKIFGDVCFLAKTAPITKQEAYKQLSKLNDTYFYLSNFEYDGDAVFVSKGELNSLRRHAVTEIMQHYMQSNLNKNDAYAIKNKILHDMQTWLAPQGVLDESSTLDAVASSTSKACTCGQEEGDLPAQIKFIFGDDANNFDKINSLKQTLVIRPNNYLSYDYKKITNSNTFLYIPAFLRCQDIKVIEEILIQNPNLKIYAENIAALNYNRKTILGAKLNIKNLFAIKQLVNKKIVGIVPSVELNDINFEIIRNSINISVYKMFFSNMDLMTLVHCPIKMLFNNTCRNCEYQNGIIYKMDNSCEFILNRYKIANCYFVLMSTAVR